ncbi:MAG: hypothetical protein J5902_01700 [Paludibacteraceae bacterium]|nr:hypothetical protein [Paludibacteraceae bacterium]
MPASNAGVIDEERKHTAWATSALRLSGRGGIFSGLVQNMTLICRTRWSNYGTNVERVPATR